MKNFLEKLTPFFLKALDRQSLLHNRLLWITKVHYVLFYVGIAFLLSMAYIRWHPTPYNLPRSEMFALISTFIILIPLSYWVFKQISFSIERNYGKRYAFLDQMRFGLYLVCTMAFLSIPFGSVLMMQHRVANFVDDQTLAQDEKSLNLYNPFFLTEHEINAKVTDIETNTKMQFLLDNGYDHNTYYSVMDTYKFPKALHDRISEKTQNICSFYNPTALTYYSSYKTEPARIKDKVELSDYQIFKANVWDNTAQHKAYIAEYIRLFNKYGGNIKLSADEIINIRQNEGVSVVNMAHHIAYLADQKHTVQSNIGRISNEKYDLEQTQAHTYQIFSVMFFLSFFLSLLLSIYNMVRLKDFIVSAVGFIAVAIGVAMLAVLTNEIFGSIGQNNDSTLLFLGFGVYAVALVQSLRIFAANSFSMFKAICLIMTTFATPFVIWWLGLMQESMNGYMYHSDQYYIHQIWLGILGFVLFIEPLFRKLFLKISSLPKG